MRVPLALGIVALLSGCVTIPAPNLTFEIDCPVPAGRDHFPATGEVECHAYGPLTRLGDVDWEFGDGAMAEGDTVRHTYPGPGSYVLHASLWPETIERRVGIPADLVLMGNATPGALAGRPVGEAASVSFDVLANAHLPTIVIDTPGGTTRLHVALVGPDGEDRGACSCTTPAEFPLLEAVHAGTYTLHVWGDVGPGYAPARSTPFEARIFIPYESSFLGPFRLP